MAIAVDADLKRPRLRRLGCVEYAVALRQMREFTDHRDDATADEIWLLEHPPVFTQGQAGRAEHLLAPGTIPVVASDRGGQITYHGPGQAIAYVLLDLHRLGIGVRSLVDGLETAMIEVLAGYGIRAFARREAPGVYVDESTWTDGDAGPRKIGSLGLRVRRGRCYHGLALNVDMDLAPFSGIDPCGMPGLRMTQIRELAGRVPMSRVFADLGAALCRRFGYHAA